MEVDNMA